MIGTTDEDSWLKLLSVGDLERKAVTPEVEAEEVSEDLGESLRAPENRRLLS